MKSPRATRRVVTCQTRAEACRVLAEAPKILKALGVPVPPDLDGKPLM